MKKLFYFLMVLVPLCVVSCDKKDVNGPDGTGTDVEKEKVVKPHFYISANKKVLASSGNLQYQPSSKTYRFAPKQYDIIRESNLNITDDYNGWIDWFAWGTGDR